MTTIPKALARAIEATGYTLAEGSGELHVDGITVLVTAPNEHYVAFYLDPETPMTDALAAEYARPIKFSLDGVADHPAVSPCPRCGA
jgi:hypothetical protein